MKHDSKKTKQLFVCEKWINCKCRRSCSHSKVTKYNDHRNWIGFEIVKEYYNFELVDKSVDCCVWNVVYDIVVYPFSFQLEGKRPNSTAEFNSPFDRRMFGIF